MNEASKWRLKFARSIGSFYAENPKVAAAIVGGSTARGHADRFSDIEIGGFWNEAPTEDERHSVIERAGAELVYLYPFDPSEESWSDDYRMGHNQAGDARSGSSVETIHYTKEFTQRILDEVLREYDPDENKQNLISGIVDGITVHGIDLIEQWKSRAAEYPQPLAVAVMKRHAQISHFWRWEMWMQRGENRMLLHQYFSETQAKILHVLLALNKVYYFGFKWLDVVNKRLTIAPENLIQRMRDVHALALADGVQQLTSLVEETYDLIEQQYPDLDVDWLRKVFRYKRPTWAEAPNI